MPDGLPAGFSFTLIAVLVSRQVVTPVRAARS